MARKTGSHSETTGPKVRAAALRLIARHGYAAVSMRQIAAEVGVQAGALYSYTPDKQSLLFDLMRSHMEELLTARAAARAPGPPPVRLEDFTRFHIRHHLRRAEAVFVSYMELRSLSSENFREIERLRRAYEDDLEGILRDGIAGGDFRIADSKVTTLALIAMLTGLPAWYREGGRLDAAALEALYLDLVRGAVGLPAKALVAEGAD